MLVERIWANNELRNYHYLIACEETGEALALDPFDATACLRRAAELGWSIRQVFNTHSHWDHINGNSGVIAASGAALLAHAKAGIADVTRGLAGGDVVQVGRTVQLHCLDTPGHTRSHLCLYAELASNDAPALFSGDTLFNAGVGNCTRGGDPNLLYDTCTTTLAALPGRTRLFPGHDYLLRNLAFTLDREPSNGAARQMAQECTGMDASVMPILTLDEERQINVFHRLHSPEVHEGLKRRHAEWQGDPSPRIAFLALRALRDQW